MKHTGTQHLHRVKKLLAFLLWRNSPITVRPNEGTPPPLPCAATWPQFTLQKFPRSFLPPWSPLWHVSVGSAQCQHPGDRWGLEVVVAPGDTREELQVWGQVVGKRRSCIFFFSAAEILFVFWFLVPAIYPKHLGEKLSLYEIFNILAFSCGLRKLPIHVWVTKNSSSRNRSQCNCYRKENNTLLIWKMLRMVRVSCRSWKNLCSPCHMQSPRI